ncbi:MAG: glycosyltransferase family 4 protein [Anaerolineae bacterium]
MAESDDEAQGDHSIKVLMIAPTSFFSDYGGHIRILEEALALQNLGYQIIIATYYKGRDLPGIDIRRTAPIPYRVDYEVGSSRHKIVFDIYLALKSFWVALKERPDIIHAHMHEGVMIGWVLSILFRVPLVFDFQGSLTAEMIDHNFLRHSSPFHRLIRRSERFLNHRADVILTSSAQAHHTLHYEYRVPDDRIFALPDCVDTERFNPDLFSAESKVEIREQLGIRKDETLVVYLGLLTDYQGIPYMLQAAQKLKEQGENIFFLIMGFPDVPKYQSQAEQMGVSDRVFFTGKIDYKDAPHMLSIGDIAITAKISTTEGSGKMLNYMALGLPIVAFDTPVHREYLGEHGSWVEPHDVDGMVQVLSELSHSPEKRKMQGDLLRTRVTNIFTWPAAAKKVQTVYNQLLNK